MVECFHDNFIPMLNVNYEILISGSRSSTIYAWKRASGGVDGLLLRRAHFVEEDQEKGSKRSRKIQAKTRKGGEGSPIHLSSSLKLSTSCVSKDTSRLGTTMRVWDMVWCTQPFLLTVFNRSVRCTTTCTLCIRVQHGLLGLQAPPETHTLSLHRVVLN